jgi:DNA-directed RNA polymerase subunit E'/Rpb7
MTSKGPYFITTLEADVRVHPNQMDNNITDHVRTNLERVYLNKCYENYGYIDKIIDVDNNIKGGIIRAEDTTSSSVHRVKFNCRICNPMKLSVIAGRIASINNMMIVAENGPIRFVINGTQINTDNIQFKKSAFYPVTSKREIINKPIGKDTYVLIRVMNKKIVKNKKNIIVFGRLESVVPDDKIKDTIRDQYVSGDKISADDLLYERVIESSTPESDAVAVEESEKSDKSDESNESDD